MIEENNNLQSTLEETNRKLSNDKLATFAQVFSNAKPYDYFLMGLGSIGGAITGIIIPLSILIFGKIMDKLNASQTSPNFSDAINQLCIIFCILAGATFISGFCQVKTFFILKLYFDPNFYKLFVF